MTLDGCLPLVSQVRFFFLRCTHALTFFVRFSAFKSDGDVNVTPRVRTSRQGTLLLPANQSTGKLGEDDPVEGDSVNPSVGVIGCRHML